MKRYLKGFRKRVAPHWTDIWPAVIARMEAQPSIQLGSGMTAKLSNTMHLDINPDAKPDVVWDLNLFPYPFESNSFDVVTALSILEHLKDFIAVMGEIHRISKPSASVYILVPHFSSAAAFTDPTHCRHFGARSCDYFIEGSDIEKDYGYYIPYRYRLVRRYIELMGLLNYVWPIRWFVNRFPAFWEEYFCYIIRGKGVFWELEVVK